MMKKRLLSLLLVCVMLLGVFPATALADDDFETTDRSKVTASENGVELLKRVEEKDGNLILTMEAYVTGTVVQSTPDPLDIVLVLDVSGSMDEDISITTKSVKKKVNRTQLYTYLNFKYGDGEYFYSEDGVIFYPIVNIERDGLILSAEYTYTYQVSEDTTASVTVSILDDSNYWNKVYYETTETVTHSKLAELKKGVNALLNKTAELNTSITDSNKQHRVSVVKFASETTRSAVGNEWYDPEEATGWGSSGLKYNYTQVVSNLTYDMDATEKAVDDLFAGGATAADKGLQLANDVFDDASANRKKVVIFFTDGEPTYGNTFSSQVANAAIANAKTMKDKDVTVYSIGVVKDAKPDDIRGNVNRFLNAVSSNYPNAESLSSLGEDSNAGYYKTASQSGQLVTIFGDIINEIVTPAVGSKTVLTDTLSDYFVFPEETTGSDVTVEFWSATGNAEKLEDIEWKVDKSYTGMTSDVVGKTVYVSGFDYSANAVMKDANGNWIGKKLVIHFPIQVDMNQITQTGYYPTNNTDPDKGSKAGLGDVELDTSPEVKIEVAEPDPTYTLTYDLNGGTEGTGPSLNPVTGLTAQTYTLSNTAPTHADVEGKKVVFIGWTLEKDEHIYTKNDDDKGALLASLKTTVDINSDTVDDNGNITVYAVWGYNINANTNDTPDVLENTYSVTYKYENAPEGVTAPVDNEKYLEGETVTTKTVGSVEGYGFSGWTKGTDTVEPGNTFTMPASDVELVGTWTKNAPATVTLTYDANGGAWGSAVSGYLMDPEYTTASITYQASYTLSAFINPDPNRDGYDFTGWYRDKECKERVKIPETLSSDTTFYAGWKLKEVEPEPEPEPEPELKVTKRVDKNTAKVGEILTYTIEIENSGDTTLEDIKISDVLSNGTKLVLKDKDGNPVTEISYIEPGDTVTLYATYTVKASDAGKTLRNTAVAETSDADDDGSCSTEIDKNDNTHVITPSLNKKDHVAYIIGYEDLTVRPENNITRAEVATIFFRLMDDSSRSYFWSQKNDFSDVSKGDWFNNAVSTMANAGILSGYPDGTFKPNAPITRAEFSAIAARFSDVVYGGKSSFSDVAKTFWAYDEIALAEHLGWITGYPDGTFRPGQNITRAEAMTLINRVLERAVEQEHMLKDMVQWKDNSPSAWYYEAVQEATNSHTYTRLSKKVPNQSFNYEDWVKILENPDWAALEKTWSKN